MISILIPIYNGIEFFEECLKSILNQTYNDWEIIIGINGYPQNSDVENLAKEIVYKYNSDNKYKILVNYYDTKGKANTLNKMVKDSNYNFIAILDVDDYWLPTKLEEQIHYLNYYDVIGTDCSYFGDYNGSPDIPMGDLTNFNFFIVNPIICSSVIIKKELAKWNNIFGVEDYDLWLKLFCNKKLFYNVNKKLCMHRVHKQSVYNSTSQQENNLKEILQKWRYIYDEMCI